MRLSWARSRSGLARRPGPPPGDWPRSPNWYVAAAGTTSTRTGRATPGMPPPQRSRRCWVSRAAGLPGRWTSALSLRYRLPRVAELFMEGRLSYRVCAAIAAPHRTRPGSGAARAHRLRDLAPRAELGTAVSTTNSSKAIDVWVDRFDPGALRHTRARAQDRGVHVGSRVRRVRASPGSPVGCTATDAALLDRRLKQMAHGVCDDDPRTIAQRRADALGALAAGSDRLACQCGSPECPASDDDGRAASVVVHVVTDADAATVAPDSNSGQRRRPTKATATLTGRGGIVPTPLLAELIASGATVRHVRRPSDEPEPGYRPSTALEEFVRFRDLTCRFPNCDMPAEFCDVDHTIPWPLGPTHPSNLKCVCRKEPLAQDILGRLVGPAVPRRHRRMDLTDRQDLPHASRQPNAVPALEHHDGHTAATTLDDTRPVARTHADDANPTTNTSPGPRLPHQT